MMSVTSIEFRPAGSPIVIHLMENHAAIVNLLTGVSYTLPIAQFHEVVRLAAEKRAARAAESRPNR